MKCWVEGCDREGTVKVVLSAAVGSGSWRSCWDHALEFEQWVREENERQGGDFAEVFLWTHAERSA
jgi:hypothetical protein